VYGVGVLVLPVEFLVYIGLCLIAIIVMFLYYVFLFNDTSTTEIYTLSLHDALPISIFSTVMSAAPSTSAITRFMAFPRRLSSCRSEEHTSELQSRENLVCRLLLEKKKIIIFRT